MVRTKLENLLMELENRHWSWAETEGMLQNCSDREYDRLIRISKQFNQQYYETRVKFVEEMRRLEEIEVSYRNETGDGNYEKNNI